MEEHRPCIGGVDADLDGLDDGVDDDDAAFGSVNAGLDPLGLPDADLDATADGGASWSSVEVYMEEDLAACRTNRSGWKNARAKRSPTRSL